MRTKTIANPPVGNAVHTDCDGGELVLPTGMDGSLIGAKQTDGQYRYMVRCEGCGMQGGTDDELLLAVARRVPQRFVVEATR